ncbi:MAG: DUF3768 domain-containing protein [Pseudomonadota bacterium]
MSTDTLNKHEVIAAQNDCVRGALVYPSHQKTCAELGLERKLVWTQGVDAEFQAKGNWQRIMRAIADFNAFDDDNDPRGERDFFAFEVDGTKMFLKVDYYGPDLRCGSEDPADPKQTIRVMTIMLPSEY